MGTATADIAAQLEAIDSLVPLVDAGTVSGQAVLAAVRRDLIAAYETLAAYVRRSDRDGR